MATGGAAFFWLSVPPTSLKSKAKVPNTSSSFLLFTQTLWFVFETRQGGTGHSTSSSQAFAESSRPGKGRERFTAPPGMAERKDFPSLWAAWGPFQPAMLCVSLSLQFLGAPGQNLGNPQGWQDLRLWGSRAEPSWGWKKDPGFTWRASVCLQAAFPHWCCSSTAQECLCLHRGMI